MIVIRADANSKIGMGHVMRCTAIADRLREKGEQVCFLVADENPVPLLQGKGIPCHVLHTDYSHMEEETGKLTALLDTLKPSAILIDSYYVTPEYLREVRRRTRTVYLDDIFAFSYPVDLLINYNIYAKEMGYGKLAGGQDACGQPARFCLGTSYVPLRQEFSGVPYTVKDRAEQILITTGGSDSYNLAGQFLEEALRQEETKNKIYHVICGSLNPHRDSLQALAAAHGNIRIHSNVTNMAELMRQCDVAISAGGSTMYELCAVGVPTITFSFAANQERIVESFLRLQYAAGGGNYLVDKEKLAPAVIRILGQLCGDREKRMAYSSKARTLVDGRGAERIADAILAYF